MTFLEAFVLPSAHANPGSATTSVLLSPSHRGIAPGINVRESVLLHDAVLDPTTQDILIAIRVHAYEPSRSHGSRSQHGILRLSCTRTSDDHGSEVGTITFQLLGSLGKFSQTPFVYPSFNGTGRVFYGLESGVISVLEYDLHASNGDGEHEARVTQYPSILRVSRLHTLLSYDPCSGRLCLGSSMGRYNMNVIEILDLAV